ncbi:hypothetical protein UA08_09395 [Talaromyces atroroseus]|uniref:Transcription factor domain-containing protein n=1 Tax=Talaromyces atroroseus TaxID=1441469 RepID=A0A1Q5Q623_TALAT|nr:hypothetical protein UA08_09395 [Talaromyces atroroseus]OKL55316.1 hypothetical protein UA08_09395 [Talaromyces atroroseus]
MPNDKFIFVNAPTIINAGPRDARRELRSQLMRRVYFKKYQVSPPPSEDDLANVNEEESVRSPKSGRRGHSLVNTTVSPPAEYDTEVSQTLQEKYGLVLRNSPVSNLPTPPDDNEQDVPQPDNAMHQVSPPKPANARKKTPKHIMRTKNLYVDKNKQRIMGDPNKIVVASFTSYFDYACNTQDSPNSNVLLQHYTRVILPALRVANEWRQNMFLEYVQANPEPLLFHTLCLTSSIHLDKIMLWNGVEAQRRQRELEQSHYRYTCLRELRKALIKPKYGTVGFDAILVGLCMLAICDPVGDLPASVDTMDHNPFSHALLSLGALNIFGYEPIHPVHWKGLLTLIDQHGGFDSLRMYGSKWKISYTALKYSTHTDTKPAFPVCNERGESLVNFTPLEILHISPSSLPSISGTGFLELNWFSIRNSIQRTFVELGQLAESMHKLMPHRDDVVVRDRLTDARNLIQYRFSNLPLMTGDPRLIVDLSTDGKDKDMNTSSTKIMEIASIVYGMCWLVGHLFTTHVTFPVPSCRRFRVKTVLPLRELVDKCGHALKCHPVFMKLQLWCMVIGGIAAEDIDTDLRQWTVIQTRILCYKLGLQDWEEVTTVMRSFAWMESACGYGGRKLWAEVQNWP